MFPGFSVVNASYACAGTQVIARGSATPANWRELVLRSLVVAVLLFSNFVGQGALAQGNTATLTGVVRDVSGRPLPGAAVVIDPDDNPVSTRTTPDGTFRFDRIQRGDTGCA
jgi:hypothetical protein